MFVEAILSYNEYRTKSWQVRYIHNNEEVMDDYFHLESAFFCHSNLVVSGDIITMRHFLIDAQQALLSRDASDSKFLKKKVE